MTTTTIQPGDTNNDGGLPASSHHGPDADQATTSTPVEDLPIQTCTPVSPATTAALDRKTSSEPVNTVSNEITDPEPDILGPEDIHEMRVKLREFGLITTDLSSSTSSRAHSEIESELAAMVLRLISHHECTANSDLSNQLSTQAHTIASLTSQRNFLMAQYALSCASWQAEREGWDRSAEALIAQRAAAAAVTKEELIDRNIYRLEDDNKRLREKLSETQQRVSVLESQLFNLRPLLLIPPVPPESSGSSNKHKRPSVSGAPRGSQTTPADRAPKARAQQATESVIDAVLQDGTGAVRRSSPISGQANADLEPVNEAPTTPARHMIEDRPATPLRPIGSQSLTPPQPSPPSSLRQNAEIKGRPTGANIYSPLPQPSHTPQLSQSADYSNRPRSTYYRTAKDYEISLARPRQTRASKAQPAHPLMSALTWLADQQSASTSTSGSSLGLGLGGNVGIGPAKKSSALMSDAKAELVLAAARRMGKARASRVAGMLGIDVSKTVREIKDERRAEVREEVHLVSEGWGKALEREAGEKAKEGSTGKLDKGKGKATESTDAATEKNQETSASPKKPARRKPVKKAATMPTLQVGAQPPLPAPQGPGGSSSYYASFHSMSHLVVLNPAQSGRMPSGGGVPMLVPVGSVWPPPGARPPHIATASSSLQNPASDSPDAQAGPSTIPLPPRTPPLPRSDAASTPPKRADSQPQSQGLDSLLNAARLLDEEYDSPSEEPPTAPKAPRRSVRRTRRSAAAEPDEEQGSPSKRRKVAGSPTQSPLSSMTPEPPPKTTKSGLGRVSSALDVLADQAAQEQERRPSLGVEPEQRTGTGFRKPTSSERPVSPVRVDEAVVEEALRQRARVSKVRRSHSASRHSSPVPPRSTWQAPPHAPSPLAVHTREHTPHLSDQDAPGSPDDSAAEERSN